ncbi:MAG: PqqD family protein [Flavobacteriaceae bacterium]
MSKPSVNSVIELLPSVSHQVLGRDQGGVVVQLESGDIFSVNDTAADFLKAADGERTIADIAAMLAETYDAPAETIAADLVEITEGLIAEKVVQVKA